MESLRIGECVQGKLLNFYGIFILRFGMCTLANMNMNASILSLSLIAAITVAACNSSGNSKTALPDKISYNFHIRPILSDKCFACHGPDANKRQASLRLDKEEAAFAPLKETKGAFAIVKGKPEESELFKRITSTDPDYQMPTPEAHVGLLNEHEIALFRKWIQQGGKYEKHWAFTAPVKPEIPETENKKWPVNEIDKLVLSQLENKGLSPNEETDKERLLKRVSFDLTGLPPSLEMMDEFSADNSANAYEKVVDKLMASPAYGEKLALYWLDISRYADSYGYQDDNIRTQWPYRDWLIHAFNTNIPYNKFLTWQIAGDMLPNATKEQKLATAFFRNHKYTEEGGVVPEEYRVEYTVDKIKTFSKGILGLTVECAQCHDHKFDPVSQKDYYSLYAFFNNTKEAGYEGDVSVSKPAKTPFMTISDSDISTVMSYINKKDTAQLTVSVMEENDTLRKTYILDRGVYDKPKGQVFPYALPSVMNFDSTKFSKNRLGLAKWTVDPKNPLTARVFINHIWQQFFGRGLVKSTGDFGMQGDLPTNPQLLDWLAVDFMEHGWDMKYLVKKIMMSATYRQSSKISHEKLEADPDNLYFSRGPRNRLPAELVRDMVLASSGLLVKELGGPSVKPYQPAGLWENATSGRGVLAAYKQDHGNDLYRRGVYTFIKLTVPPPSMMIFDASNRDQCEVKRSQTNTPLQALVMMNDPTVLEASKKLATTLAGGKGVSDEQVVKAFRMIVCRQPTEKEKKVLTAFYKNQLQEFAEKKLDARVTLNVGEFKADAASNANETAALMKTIEVIYNLEEAITKS